MLEPDGGGSVRAFRASWLQLDPRERYHYAPGEPANQIQFAFQNHWRVFRRILGDVGDGRALEVGCGRGSMAAFFAAAGLEMHLLDISVEALDIARWNFARDKLEGFPVCGDALALPFPDGALDAVVSIGLLEHFRNVQPPLREQLRVLRSGGVLLAYIVPDQRPSVQTLAWPLNVSLRLWHRVRTSAGRPTPRKEPLYRNDYRPEHYLEFFRQAGITNAGVVGMFPVPLVSHSPSFPFSLMSAEAERRVVRAWRSVMALRRLWRDDPWTCHPRWGLAFVIWARR